jgi:hypothetical protein
VSEREQCPRLIEVQRLWEGEIDERQAGEARRHLAHCSGCRAEYESWEHLSGLLARGDPAAPLVPERQRRLKEQLLAACAASLENRSRFLVPGLRLPGTRRRALVLAPLAAALLLLLVLGRHVPPGALQPTGEQSRIGTAPPPPRLETRPRPPRSVRLPPPQPAPPPTRFAGNRPASPGARKRPRRVVRPRHIVRLARSMAAPPERPRGRGFRQRNTARPAEERWVVAPGSRLAAPKPIERLVIQIGAPPPVEAGTITHVSISAVGDPRAPGAQLAVVRSRREEALP